MTAPAAWILAAQALAAFAVDPVGLGGLWIRARSGPVRDRLMTALADALPLQRLSPLADDAQLYGGLDVAATLAASKPIFADGLLARGGVCLVPMAERISPELAGRLGMALDAGKLSLVALDEGIEDEVLPSALQDRLACPLSLEGLPAQDCPEIVLPDIAVAQARLSDVVLPPDALQHLAALAAHMGIASLRAPLHALRVARARMALGDEPDAALETAIRLTLAPRMLTPPPAEEDEAEDDTPPDQPDDPSDSQSDQNEQSQQQTDEELLLEAAKALLPDDLLAAVAAMPTGGAAAGASKAGAKRSGNRRGRRLPSRRGKASSAAKIDLLATLRTAAPWQPMRRKARPDDPRPILIEAGDIHTRRTQDVSDRVIVFAVDASGSTALARLAEAKGAIEILLAEAYARRDHVALIAFRGQEAEVLLPPTRSIVQTKRRLAALPGGGGTPLAAGLRAAHGVLDLARRKGMAPTLVVLTDGVANIALDGEAGRAKAGADALEMAKALRMQNAPCILIDTARRMQPLARELSEALDARYVPMPRADARRMAGAVSDALT